MACFFKISISILMFHLSGTVVTQTLPGATLATDVMPPNLAVEVVVAAAAVVMTEVKTRHCVKQVHVPT